MVVTKVMLCDSRTDPSGKTKRSTCSSLAEKPQFIFVSAGQFNYVTAIKRQEIFTVDMRLHLFDMFHVHNGGSMDAL